MFDPNPIKENYIEAFKKEFNQSCYLKLVKDKKESKKIKSSYITCMMIWFYTKRESYFWRRYYDHPELCDTEFWTAVTEIGLFMGMKELPLDVDFNFKKFENTEYEKLFT